MLDLKGGPHIKLWEKTSHGNARLDTVTAHLHCYKASARLDPPQYPQIIERGHSLSAHRAPVSLPTFRCVIPIVSLHYSKLFSFTPCNPYARKLDLG